MNLDEYTWEELKTISKELVACNDEKQRKELAIRYGLRNSSGQLDGTQRKNIVFKDGNTASVQLIGICHDENDSGKVGLSFILKDCVTFGSMDDNPLNAKTWANSTLRQYMNNEWIRWIPDDLHAVMVPARKTCAQSINQLDSVSDLLWLPSLAEIIPCGSVGWENSPLPLEGSQYELFLDSWSNPSLVQKKLKGVQPDPDNTP